MNKIISDISYNLPFGIPGYRFENSNHNFELGESLTSNSQITNFKSHTIYFQSQDSTDLAYKFSYNRREDDQKSSLDSTFTKANTISAYLRRNGRKNQLDVSMHLRSLETFTNTKSYTENSLTSQFNWQQKFLKNILFSDLGFSTSTARELKREFVYVKVDDGTGTHTWRDENQNGLQELDEFYLAILADERSYAKFFTPTSEYLQVYASNLNYRIKLMPPSKWHSKKGLTGFLSKFSITSALNAAYKTSAETFAERLLPFLFDVNENVLVSKHTSLRASLFFNRTNPKNGLELQFLKNNRKQLLTGGFEGNDIQELKLIFRHNFNNNLSNNIELGSSAKSSFSDFLINHHHH